MSRNAVLTALVMVLSVSTVACASDHSGPARAIARKRHTSVDAYPLEQSARAAVHTHLNTTGVIGHVEQIGAPAVLHLSEETLKATHTPNGASVNNLVSTPVSVRVAERLFGPYGPGEIMTLRILGGETGDAVTTAEQAAILDRITVGSQIAVFGGRAVVYADGATQTTPSQVFVADGDTFVPTLRPDAATSAPTSANELRQLTAQRPCRVDVCNRRRGAS